MLTSLAFAVWANSLTGLSALARLLRLFCSTILVATPQKSKLQSYQNTRKGV